MSQPSFLLANETNHLLLFSLLDGVNAILEHQYEGASNCANSLCFPMSSSRGALSDDFSSHRSSNSCFVNVLGVEVLCSDWCTENRRFVEVIVKSRKRFEALRDFTVEGALEEVDRIARERKDAGEATEIRNASIDSARSPVTARLSTLGDVPEDSAFAIGDDEEEEEESAAGVSTPTSTVASAVEDAVPLQSRSMSEKARGKQPVNQTSFSRSTSRNTSNASLTLLTTPQTSTSQQPFAPTPEWVRI